MARVEIEERAWSDPKMKRLCASGGITRSHAIGLLATLWHDSQEEMKVTATDEDLRIWFCDEYKNGIDAIQTLVASGHLEFLPDKNRYRISGNFMRIKKVRAYKARAKLSAHTRWGKNSHQNAPENFLQNENSTSTSPSRNFLQNENTVGENHIIQEQYRRDERNASSIRDDVRCAMLTTNSKQLDNKQPSSYEESSALSERMHLAHARDDLNHESDQEGIINLSHLDPNDFWTQAAMKAQQVAVEKAPNSNPQLFKPEDPASIHLEQENASELKFEAPGNMSKKEAPKKKASKPGSIGTDKFIAHFISIYSKHYPNEKIMYGREAGAAKQIVKAVGLERAMQLADSYLLMKDDWFKTKRHSIATLADNLDNVANFMMTGRQITSVTIKSEALDVHNRSVVDGWLAKKRMQNEGDVIDVQTANG
jgi:hypothetical protein